MATGTILYDKHNTQSLNTLALSSTTRQTTVATTTVNVLVLVIYQVKHSVGFSPPSVYCAVNCWIVVAMRRLTSKQDTLKLQKDIFKIYTFLNKLIQSNKCSNWKYLIHRCETSSYVKTLPPHTIINPLYPLWSH